VVFLILYAGGAGAHSEAADSNQSA
jgi:hypothetical protein